MTSSSQFPLPLFAAANFLAAALNVLTARARHGEDVLDALSATRDEAEALRDRLARVRARIERVPTRTGPEDARRTALHALLSYAVSGIESALGRLSDAVASADSLDHVIGQAAQHVGEAAHVLRSLEAIAVGDHPTRHDDRSQQRAPGPRRVAGDELVAGVARLLDADRALVASVREPIGTALDAIIAHAYVASQHLLARRASAPTSGDASALERAAREVATGAAALEIARNTRNPRKRWAELARAHAAFAVTHRAVAGPEHARSHRGGSS